jgi:selenocysteine lyase/cysteine desulfurase
MHFPLDEIRNRFPALSGPGEPPIYLDNPAGTLVPRSVIDAVISPPRSGPATSGPRHMTPRPISWVPNHRAR